MTKTNKINHIDFYISYQCQNNCIFCSASSLMSKFRNHPLKFKEISDLLKRKRKEGITSVNFTGGEPTLYPEFGVLLKLAKELKFKVYVNTNGERFADPEFVKKTAPLIDEVCFSIQGPNNKVHDFLMNTKGSFKRQLKGLKNLSRYPIRLFSNLVVTKFNFDFLEETVRFAFKNGVQELLVSNLVPEGRGIESYSQLVVKLKDAQKIIPKLTKIADFQNRVIRFFGFPMCVLKSYAVCSNDFFFDKRLYVERGLKRGKSILKQKKVFFPDYKRTKPPKCKNCLYNKVCGGVFKEYYKIFGDKELAPIKNA